MTSWRTSLVDRLRERGWEVGYASDEVDVVREFYEPAMGVAIQYDRAVGYFSSRALVAISGGIERLYRRNGKIRLIASPAISPEDRDAIARGLEDRDRLIETRLLDYLDASSLSADERSCLELLTGMIATGLLEIRIAVKEEPDGSVHLYHEKLGVFTDESGDFMTFIGSPNETWNGWVGNAESIALHTSWGPAEAHASAERARFERTWKGDRRRVAIFPFPDACRAALFEHFHPKEPDGTPISGVVLPESRPAFPRWLDGGDGLRDYQKEAVNAWLDAGGRGVFAMATGTGKTITALTAALRLAGVVEKAGQSLAVLVVVPSADLVGQWRENAGEFGFAPVCCSGQTSSTWPSDVRTLARRLSFGDPATAMIIVTADTLVTSRFQGVLANLRGRMLIIADEMHSVGTVRRRSALPLDAEFRLGLSATPRRHGDEIGTRALLDYFGDVVQRIDIKRAIELRALVPYHYYPVIVGLQLEELDEYRRLTAEIGRALGGVEDGDRLPDRAKWLMLERSRLIGHAHAKLGALRKILSGREGSSHNLVYVAEGVHPLSDIRQLDAVRDMMADQMQMSINVYTSDTRADDRSTFQQMLRDGRLQALIAMRCLDEGIDIPEARCGIILASTQNPRQFVQRRGRILRRDDQGGKQNADLFDVLVVPDEPPPRGTAEFRMERRLVGRELTRALELASASLNGREVAPPELVDVMERYDLLEALAGYPDGDEWEQTEEELYGE